MPDRPGGLGRRQEFDPRSRQFPVSEVLRANEGEGKVYRPRSYTWSIPVHLDQGQEGSCVGFSWAHELIARPAVIDDGWVTPGLASWIYKMAQHFDPWPGTNYEGTSVLAGAKVIQQRPPQMNPGRGLIGEYRWIFGDLDEIIKVLGYFGPVIIGCNWYTGMFNTDSNGFLNVTGNIAGGHALVAKAVSLPRKAVLLHNSWGPGWGMGGDAWLRFDDLMRLLGEQGEVVVPMKRYRLVN